MVNSAASRFSVTALMVLPLGCAPIQAPTNLNSTEPGGLYQAQYRDPPVHWAAGNTLMAARLNSENCQSDPNRVAAKGIPEALLGEFLSPNDLVDVRVDEDETFAGAYVVSGDGNLKLPYIDPVKASGRTVEQVEAALQDALERDDFYQDRPRVSVRVMDLAEINVAVTGAVFEPRAVDLGGQAGDKIDSMRQGALGAANGGRDLARALRVAGGIRPDADITAVELHRQSKVYTLNLSGIFAGASAREISLISGDEIVVPSRKCFQEELMKPGPISPPGVSLFQSNLTVPSPGNASAAVTDDARQVPYGTRMLQALVGTNCVGGARATNANRSGVLITRNPITGVSTVIERRVENMLRRPDRDDYNPYLLPGDSVACYDSSVTNLTDVLKAIGIGVGVGLLVQ